MNPFVRLGVSADADEAQIKRAYAKLLRITRPDDDPTGFQQLNDAYQRCLARARQRALATAEVGLDTHDQQDRDDDGDDADAQGGDAWTAAEAFEFEPIAPEPRVQAPDFDHQPRIVAPPDPSPRPVAIPPAPDPFTRPAAGAGAHAATHPNPLLADLYALATATAVQAEPAFDLAGFLDELSHAAQTKPPEALQRWLDHHPELYSLTQQQAVARELVAHLSYAPSLYIAQLDMVLRFFGLDTVGEGVPSTQMRIDELRARAKARGGDFREIKFQRDPRPGERGDHPTSIPWGAIGFFLAMLVLSIAMTMRTAYGG
ncbi:J domain-containing protein [Lysobacter capsici]|uniref:J domain-containing protein n=1 Tax=Lysobacter capsici TaxID=435897 RepID=UPI001C0044C6|nr:J domain-containing protein [Lysobacter capsici]QWF15134.1 J domain-containing protein [Lysobacter capsici]